MLISLGLIAAGSLLLITHDRYARYVIKYQNKAWGFHFGEREIKASKFVIIFVGFALIVWGVLGLLDLAIA
jgi:hypothetical protein